MPFVPVHLFPKRSHHNYLEHPKTKDQHAGKMRRECYLSQFALVYTIPEIPHSRPSAKLNWVYRMNSLALIIFEQPLHCPYLVVPNGWTWLRISHLPLVFPSTQLIDTTSEKRQKEKNILIIAKNITKWIKDRWKRILGKRNWNEKSLFNTGTFLSIPVWTILTSSHPWPEHRPQENRILKEK